MCLQKKIALILNFWCIQAGRKEDCAEIFGRCISRTGHQNPELNWNKTCWLFLVIFIGKVVTCYFPSKIWALFNCYTQYRIAFLLKALETLKVQLNRWKMRVDLNIDTCRWTALWHLKKLRILRSDPGTSLAKKDTHCLWIPELRAQASASTSREVSVHISCSLLAALCYCSGWCSHMSAEGLGCLFLPS